MYIDYIADKRKTRQDRCPKCRLVISSKDRVCTACGWDLDAQEGAQPQSLPTPKEGFSSNPEQGRDRILQIGGTVWLLAWFLYAAVHSLFYARGALPAPTTPTGLATNLMLAFALGMPIALFELWRCGPKSWVYRVIAALPASLVVIAWISLLFGWGRRWG